MGVQTVLPGHSGVQAFPYWETTTGQGNSSQAEGSQLGSSIIAAKPMPLIHSPHGIWSHCLA